MAEATVRPRLRVRRGRRWSGWRAGTTPGRHGRDGSRERRTSVERTEAMRAWAEAEGVGGAGRCLQARK
eukprot:3539703-Rhodomonas_salina.1